MASRGRRVASKQIAFAGASGKQTAALTKQQRQEQKEEIVKWLLDNYKLTADVAIPRDLVYQHYCHFCQQNELAVGSRSYFTKTFSGLFPCLPLRRLGHRGDARYFYDGLDIQETSDFYSKVAPDRILQKWQAQSRTSSTPVCSFLHKSFLHKVKPLPETVKVLGTQTAEEQGNHASSSTANSPSTLGSNSHSNQYPGAEENAQEIYTTTEHSNAAPRSDAKSEVAMATGPENGSRVEASVYQERLEDIDNLLSSTASDDEQILGLLDLSHGTEEQISRMAEQLLSQDTQEHLCDLIMQEQGQGHVGVTDNIQGQGQMEMSGHDLTDGDLGQCQTVESSVISEEQQGQGQSNVQGHGELQGKLDNGEAVKSEAKNHVEISTPSTNVEEPLASLDGTTQDRCLERNNLQMDMESADETVQSDNDRIKSEETEDQTGQTVTLETCINDTEMDQSENGKVDDPITSHPPMDIGVETMNSNTLDMPSPLQQTPEKLQEETSYSLSRPRKTRSLFSESHSRDCNSNSIVPRRRWKGGRTTGAVTGMGKRLSIGEVRSQNWKALSDLERKAHIEQVLQWLEQEYEMAPQMCVPRQIVYDHYLDFCSHGNHPVANITLFGRILQKKFPRLTMRRLGGRGESRYFYMGIDIMESSGHYATVLATRVYSAAAKPKSSIVNIQQCEIKGSP